MDPQNKRNAAIVWLALGLAAFWIFQIFSGGDDRAAQNRVSFTEFVAAVERGEVRDATIAGAGARATLASGRVIETYVPEEAGLVATLREHNVNISAAPAPRPGFLSQLLLALLPMLLFIGVWVWMARQSQSGMGGVMGFAKSRAKMLKPDQQRVTFADVAGIDEATDELFEIVDFLRNPDRYRRLGATIPKGVLLSGPPGDRKSVV